jgi:hypothetical protein
MSPGDGLRREGCCNHDEAGEETLNGQGAGSGLRKTLETMAHNTMETARSIDEDLHVRCAESADTAFRAGPPSSLILIFNTSLSLQPFLGSKLQKIYFYGSLVPI